MREKTVLALISANFWVNNQDKALDLVEIGMGSSWILEFLFKFTTDRSNIRSKKNKTDKTKTCIIKKNKTASNNLTLLSF